MNDEGEEQCVVIPGGQEGDGFLGDVEGNKRMHSGEEDDGAVGEDGQEQKKRKSSNGVSGDSQGVIAFKDDGKKYYQCKMSDCIKVRCFMVDFACCV